MVDGEVVMMRVRTRWGTSLILLPLVALGLAVIVYKTEPAVTPAAGVDRKDSDCEALGQCRGEPAVAAAPYECRSLISFYDEPLIREWCVRTVYRK